MKVFSKVKFLTDPGASMLYQDLPQVRKMIDKLDGQPITALHQIRKKELEIAFNDFDA